MKNKKQKYKIVLTGGGSGGHIFPLIAVVRELKAIMPSDSLDLFYIGPKDNILEKYLVKEGIKIKNVFTGKVRRYIGFKAVFQNIFDTCIRIPLGILQSFFYLYFISPDMIFSKGGYGSFPIVISSKVFQIPVFLHESDSISGAANRFLQRFAAEIFTSFPETIGVDKDKMIITGNPIREEVLEGDIKEGRRVFNLVGDKPLLLILGGSQGSERINDLFLNVLRKALEDFEIIHQCGVNNYEEVSSEVDAIIREEELKKRYHVYPFLDEEKLKHAYKSANVIISRAGAGSIFEIAANGKPGIFLPLPESAQDHQTRNAYTYASTGGGIVIEESNLTSHFFLQKIKELFLSTKQIKDMEESAKNFARPRAGYIIASYIKEYLTR